MTGFIWLGQLWAGVPLRTRIKESLAFVGFAELLGSRRHKEIIFHVDFKREKRNVPGEWYKNYFVFHSMFLFCLIMQN